MKMGSMVGAVAQQAPVAGFLIALGLAGFVGAQDRSEQLSDPVSVASEGIGDVLTEARALIETDLDGAIGAYERLLTERVSELNDQWLAEAHFGLGLAYYHKTFYGLAKDHFSQALLTDYGQTNADMQVDIYNNLGVVNDLLRQYDAAISSYQQALEIESDRGRPIEMAEIYSNISLIYYNLGQWEDALAELDRAKSLLSNSDAPLVQGLIYQNQAINFYALERFDQYLDVIQKALGIYQANEAITQELQIIYNLTEDGFRRTRDLDEIADFIKEGAAKAQLNDVGIMQAYFLLQAGKLALLEGQPGIAINDFNRAIERFESLGFEPQNFPDDLYLNLIEAYARVGEVDEMMLALGDFREAELAREMAVQRTSVNELKTRLAFNEQASQLQSRTIQLQAQQVQTLRLAFVLIVVLVILVGFLIYHRARLNRLQSLYELNQQSLRRYRHRVKDGETVDRMSVSETGGEAARHKEDASPEGTRGKEWAFRRIEKAMREDRLYRHSGMTLSDFSDRVKLTKRLISESVNAFSDSTFPEYLNQFRVIHAMERLDDSASDHMSIGQILDEAGFSSRSAFYVAFKKACGMTPKEYRQASKRKSAS